MFAPGTTVFDIKGLVSQLVPPYDRLRREVVPYAAHNKCGVSLPKTEEMPEALRFISEKISTLISTPRRESDGALIWLDGDAGMGKSVIAHAVARKCEEEGNLVASFFFRVSDSKRDNVSKIIATLAYQMSIRDPACRKHMDAAIAHDPLVIQDTLEGQIEHLIIDPLKKMKGAPRAYVFVVDALDECKDAEEQTRFVLALQKLAHAREIDIRILLTTRPLPQIASALDSATLRLSLEAELEKVSAPRGTPALPPPVPDIGLANWVWTWEQPFHDPPPGARPFRKTVLIPDGKMVDSLVIDIAVDDIFALYINGKVLGSGVNWNYVHRWTIGFPRTNKVVIAVYGTNHPIQRAAAGLIATGVLWDSADARRDTHYTFRTDGTWKCLDVFPPAGFERVAFDDSDWAQTRHQARYGSTRWPVSELRFITESVGDAFTDVPGVVDAPQVTRADDLGLDYSKKSPASAFTPDLSTAEWIWTHDLPFNNPPPGPKRFRKTFLLPSGKQADSLIIDIACDDLFSLYINETAVGHGLQWFTTKRWSITFPRTDKLVIAVYATNDPVTQCCAGLLCSAVIWDSKNPRAACYKLKTDNTWKYGGTSAWDGKDNAGAPEDDWKPVRMQGVYGCGPWGDLGAPAVVSAISQGFQGIEGIADPPRAPLVANGKGSSRTIFV